MLLQELVPKTIEDPGKILAPKTDVSSLMSEGLRQLLPGPPGMAVSIRTLHLFWFMVLNLLASASAKFSVLGPQSPVIGVVGTDTILTCRLYPATSVQDLEVRWVSGRHNSSLSLYRGGREVDTRQIPQYQGRMQLVRDGLEGGSIGLLIRNTQLSDEGEYRCFVQSETFYDQATLELKVIGVGSTPNIHVESYKAGGIQLVCKSGGWYPEPEVMWQKHGERLPLSSDHLNTPLQDGLFQVDSPLLITGESSKDLSCVVRNRFTNQSKEAVISIAEPFFRKISPWTLGLAIIMATLLIFSPLLVCFIVKEHKEKVFLSREVDFRRAVMKPETVTLDPETGNPELIVSPDLKSVTRSDMRQDLPDGPKRFSSARCILGSNTFTSGNHYWEVLVENAGDWAAGCTRESVTRKGLITLTPDDGIWSAGVTGGQYQVLANPRPELFFNKIPQKVGVYLEHERGRLSFYNVDEGMDHIYSFHVHFTETIMPFFWVGFGVEIKICH